MLDRFVYENHLGRRFDGLPNGVFLNYNELRDYSWEYDVINNRIARFYRGIRSRKLPLLICCKTESQAINIKNSLSDLTESDIVAKKPGKIYIGDWYTTGYITASIKSDYLITKKYCKIELTLTSDDPSWYTEHKYTFLKNSGGSVGVGAGTDYPYDYKYDYANSMTGNYIHLDTIDKNAFKLLIYGQAYNPTFNIGSNYYRINGILQQGDTLLIDSLSKTIVRTKASGLQENWFDRRSRDSYIFEPIPPGEINVFWNEEFSFELTIIEKRSEPKWT